MAKINILHNPLSLSKKRNKSEKSAPRSNSLNAVGQYLNGDSSSSSLNSNSTTPLKKKKVRKNGSLLHHSNENRSRSPSNLLTRGKVTSRSLRISNEKSTDSLLPPIHKLNRSKMSYSSDDETTQDFENNKNQQNQVPYDTNGQNNNDTQNKIGLHDKNDDQENNESTGQFPGAGNSSLEADDFDTGHTDEEKDSYQHGLSSFFNVAQSAATHLLPRFSHDVKNSSEISVNSTPPTSNKTSTANIASSGKNDNGNHKVLRGDNLKSSSNVPVQSFKDGQQQSQGLPNTKGYLHPAKTKSKDTIEDSKNSLSFLKNLDTHLSSKAGPVNDEKAKIYSHENLHAASPNFGLRDASKNNSSYMEIDMNPMLISQSASPIPEQANSIIGDDNESLNISDYKSPLLKFYSARSPDGPNEPKLVFSTVEATGHNPGSRQFSKPSSENLNLHRTMSEGSALDNINFKSISGQEKTEIGNGSLTLDALGIPDNSDFIETQANGSEEDLNDVRIDMSQKVTSSPYIPRSVSVDNIVGKPANYKSLTSLTDSSKDSSKSRRRGLSIFDNFDKNQTRRRGESVGVGHLSLMNSKTNSSVSVNTANMSLGNINDELTDSSDPLKKELKKRRTISFKRSDKQPNSTKRQNGEEKVVERTSFMRSRSGSRSSNISEVDGTDEYAGNDTNATSSDEDSLISGLIKSNERRNKVFHHMLGDIIPDDEKLVSEYGCAYSKDILIQGKLYLTENYIIFKSNILGWVTTFTITINDIVQLEKKNTAVVFPNAISVQTLHKKYLFASFINRDAVFEVITRVWNNSILKTTFAGTKRVHGSRRNTNGVTATGDELHVSNFNQKKKKSLDYNGENSDEENMDSDLEDEDYSNDEDMTSDDEYEQPVTPGAIQGPQKHAPTDIKYKPTDEEKVVAEELIDAPIGTVFKVLFGTNVQYAHDIIKSQGNYNISEIPQFSEGDSTREYNYTKPIPGSIGPSKTTCFITETIKHCDFEDYCQIDQVSKTPDIPSGNSFYVRSKHFLSWGSDNKTKITIIVSVVWEKKSWLKSAIEKGTFSGVQETSVVLVKKLKEFVKEEMENVGEDKKLKEESVSEEESLEGSDEEYKLPTRGPQEHEPTDYPYEKDKADTVIVENKTINLPLGTTFEILFGDDSSFCKRIIEKQKNIEISDIPAFSNNKRKYQYVKPLGSSLGPKQTRCLVEEFIEHIDVDKYILVKQETKSPDVPSGNSFVVETKLYFSWAEKNKTKIFVVSKCVFSAKSWIKGAIEKGSNDGQKESLNILLEEMNKIIEDFENGVFASKAKGKLKKRKKSMKKNGKRKNLDQKSNKALEDEAVPTQTDANKKEYNVADQNRSLLDMILDIPNASLDKIFLWSFFIIVVSKYLFGFSFHKNVSELERAVGGNRIILSQSHYVPSLNNLYKNEKTKNSELVTQTESDIWSWIESHDFVNKQEDDKQFKNDNESYHSVNVYEESQHVQGYAKLKNLKHSRENLKTHQLQDLKEFVNVLDLELADLKSFLNYSS